TPPHPPHTTPTASHGPLTSPACSFSWTCVVCVVCVWWVVCVWCVCVCGVWWVCVCVCVCVCACACTCVCLPQLHRKPDPPAYRKITSSESLNSAFTIACMSVSVSVCYSQ